MSRQNPQPESLALKSEHASLDREIARWREWWGELCEMGQPHFGEMGDRLVQFREHLAAHFAHEENRGCLSMVMSMPPGDIERITRLRDEHPELLAELDALISRLHADEPGFDCWGSAREAFENFLDRLNAHEDAEESLVDRTA